MTSENVGELRGVLAAAPIREQVIHNHRKPGSHQAAGHSARPGSFRGGDFGHRSAVCVTLGKSLTRHNRENHELWKHYKRRFARQTLIITRKANVLGRDEVHTADAAGRGG